MHSSPPQLAATDSKSTLGWVDVVMLAGIAGLLWSVLHFGSGMFVQFDETTAEPLSTDIRNIPYYAGRTLLRMWTAFGFSLVFTFTVGYAAAKSRVAKAIILPALDIL